MYRNKLTIGIPTLVLRGALVVLLFSPQILNAQSPVWDMGVVKLRVGDLIEDWESDRQINVDPRSAEHIANEAMHFIAIFGIDYNAAGGPTEIPHVTSMIDDRDLIRQIIYGFLDDATDQNQIKNIMERMANQIGKSAELAGWPGSGPNPYKFHNFEDQLLMQNMSSSQKENLMNLLP